MTARNPRNLLNLLAITLVVSVGITLLVASYGVTQVMGRHVTDDAEKSAILLGRWMSQREIAGYIHSNAIGQYSLSIPKSEYANLEQKLRPTLELMKIVKIKIFDLNERIIFSSDSSVVGVRDEGNETLLKALAGETSSSLETKEQVTDLKHESRFQVDIVETYVPIYARDGSIVGAFETYQDATRFQQRIRSSIFTIMGILGGVLILALGFAYLSVRKASGQVELAQEQLSQLATRDFLTDLYNHREITRIGRKCFVEYQRKVADSAPAAMSLIMLDIDDFKPINDTHGHLFGDEVLRQFSQLLRSSLRECSLIGRYGGEEFLVLLPGVERSTALGIAERLCHAFSDTSLGIDRKRVNVTASLGVSSTIEADVELSQVIQRADAALYEAKRAGKNRVCSG